MKYSGGRSIDFPISTTRAPDGTRLRYFDTGLKKSNRALPAVVLANGLGGPASAWIPYLKRWEGRYRLISWDYRGLYASLLGHPTADLSVSAHAQDLSAILNHAEVERARYLGWSMGVQVGLEFYSKSPTRLSHLSLISGTYGRPLRSVPMPFSEQALPPLIRRASRLGILGSAFLATVSRSKLSYPTLRAFGVVASGLQQAHYQRMIDDFKVIDLDVYFRVLSELSRHDAEQSLGKVRVPVLVIAGSKDILTPPSLARRIVLRIPKAELFVISGATHYSTVEYPDLIADRLERFFDSTPGHELAGN